MADETILQNYASRFIFLIRRLHDKIEADFTNPLTKYGESNQRFSD